jgi:site-specific recombinase XerD
MTLLAAPLQRYFTDYAHAQRDLSPNTIASYRDTWRQLIKHTIRTRGIAADRIDLAVIDTDLVTSFLDQLTTARHNSVATCNARLTAIRAVLAQALPDHPEHADTITRVLAIPSRRRPTPTVEFLNIGETEALLAAPNTSTWTGRRDQALLALAVQTGLRISELITLTRNDIHTATGSHITCLGKGRRHRATPLTATTLTVMEPYLTERATRPGDALFPRPDGAHLSRDALEHRLAKHLNTAAATCPSLRGKHVTMHTLRHTAAMRLLQAGVDVSVIALWLGHQHTSSTDVYLHADMTIKQAAIDRTRPPHIPAGTYTPPPDILTWLDSL